MQSFPSFVVALVSAALVVSCSTQPPTSPSAAIPGAGDILSPSADRSPGLPSARSLHEPCHPNMLAPNLSSATASPATLWSPNHKWNDVTVSYTATSPCTPPQTISCSLSVSSDEPVNGLGDGNTAPDWQVMSASSVRLRAERAGVGDGRIYTITVTCTHTSGGPSTATTTSVTVAHDRGKK
jgi:hypothetical protein